MIGDIRSAIAQAFENGNFGLPVVYENTGEDQQGGQPWCEFSFTPNAPDVLTLGDDGENEHTGFAQVNLNYPLNSGIGESMDKVAEIMAVFKIGTDLVYNGQTVTVTRCGQDRGGQNENGFYQSIVSIEWRATTPR